MLEDREQPSRLAEVAIDVDANQVERIEQSATPDGGLVALQVSESSERRATTCSLQGC